MRRRAVVRRSSGMAWATSGMAGLVAFGLVAFGLVACGSAGGRPSAKASAVRASSGTSAPPPPVATPPAVTGEGAGAVAVPPVLPIDATLAAGLPALAGPAAVWRFPVDPQLDEARVLALGKTLGVGGPVQPLAAGEGGGWQLGASRHPQLRVRDDALLSWSYSSLPPDTAVASCTPPCEVKAPAGTPSPSDARARAEALLRAAGGDPGQVAWSDEPDPTGLAVTASPLLGGIPSPAHLRVVVGPGGVVMASGTLATPQPAGERARLGTTAAVEQFGSGGTLASDLPSSAETSGGAGDSTAVSPPGIGATPASEPVSGSAVAPSPATRLPVTTVCLPAPDGSEICQAAGPVAPPVHLVAVEPGLVLVPAADGTVWLLPTYRFTTATGGVVQVLAVDPSAFFKTPQPAPAGG